MRKINFIILTAILLLASCSNKNNKFPIEKRFWTVEDYENIVRNLKYNSQPDVSLPAFNDPETKIIIEKLTDEENFRVVLNDKELGLSHKNDNAQKFFDIWQDLNEIYSPMDKKDMFIYETEYLEVWKFGLELQQEYFKLGNQQIKDNSDGSENVNQVINSNSKTLIDNSIIYLDVITNEKKFTSNGKTLISETITSEFTKLIKENPKVDFYNLRKKIELLNKKIKDPSILAALNSLTKLINEVKPINESAETDITAS
jgi:hypothetical protein